MLDRLVLEYVSFRTGLRYASFKTGRCSLNYLALIEGTNRSVEWKRCTSGWQYCCGWLLNSQSGSVWVDKIEWSTVWCEYTCIMWETMHTFKYYTCYYLVLLVTGNEEIASIDVIQQWRHAHKTTHLLKRTWGLNVNTWGRRLSSCSGNLSTIELNVFDQTNYPNKIQLDPPFVYLYIYIIYNQSHSQLACLELHWLSKLLLDERIYSRQFSQRSLIRISIHTESDKWSMYM